jgi:GTP1/Obg family GTP-binding protein
MEKKNKYNGIQHLLEEDEVTRYVTEAAMHMSSHSSDDSLEAYEQYMNSNFSTFKSTFADSKDVAEFVMDLIDAEIDVKEIYKMMETLSK